MKLNELKSAAGSNKKRTIVGRGIGSGKGKTCGVGQKGQKSRSGVAIKGFEGGQMPLDRRLPKFGFNNTAFARKLVNVSLGRLQEAVDAKKLDAKKTITEDVLVEAGVIRRKKDGVKLLGTGELKTALKLEITGASASAKEAVEKAGGSVEITYSPTAPLVKGEKKANPSQGRKAKKAAAKK